MNLTSKQQPLNRVHTMIVDLAGRPCGLINAELMIAANITTMEAASALYCSALRGRTLSAAHAGDKDHRRRYFTSRDHRDTWLAGPAPDRVVYKRGPPKLAAIGERIKSKAQQPGPQIKRDKTSPGHAWRPEARQHTAGGSKMASSAASAPLVPTAIGPAPAPKLWGAARYTVDPGGFRGPLMAEWHKLRGKA